MSLKAAKLSVSLCFLHDTCLLEYVAAMFTQSPSFSFSLVSKEHCSLNPESPAPLSFQLPLNYGYLESQLNWKLPAFVPTKKPDAFTTVTPRRQGKENF